MLDKLITFALQQRVFVLAIALVVAIAGWNAWKNLPVEAFPDVQDVQVQIITQVPGQAPEEVERSVTLPIEREMSGVPRHPAHLALNRQGYAALDLLRRLTRNLRDDLYLHVLHVGKGLDRQIFPGVPAGDGHHQGDGQHENALLQRERNELVEHRLHSLRVAEAG